MWHSAKTMADHTGGPHRPEDSERGVPVSDAPKKKTRVLGEERSELAADLKRRYDEGESIRRLAAATGRSYGRSEERRVGKEGRARGGGGRWGEERGGTEGGGSEGRGE